MSFVTISMILSFEKGKKVYDRESWIVLQKLNDQ